MKGSQYITKGITLARTDYGEADRIVTFLTPEQGKVRAMCKGVRKQKSKLAGGIELFSVTDLTLIKGKGDLDTLVSSRLVTHYGEIVRDITRTMFGYDVLKVINRVLEDEGGEEYFELLRDTLEVLNNLEASMGLAEASFLMRLMRLLGHLPNLTTDVKGNRLAASDTLQFSIEDMSFFVSPAGQFNQNHVKLLRMLAHNPPKQLLKVAKLEEYLRDMLPLLRLMSRQYAITF